jgi:hypothetical protein
MELRFGVLDTGEMWRKRVGGYAEGRRLIAAENERK